MTVMLLWKEEIDAIRAATTDQEIDAVLQGVYTAGWEGARESVLEALGVEFEADDEPAA
jgi:hypothetical protein